MAKDKTLLQKEIVRNDANARRKAAFRKTWRSPVHGWTPEAPQLEDGPGLGSLALQLGIAAVGSFGFGEGGWFSGKGSESLSGASFAKYGSLGDAKLASYWQSASTPISTIPANTGSLLGPLPSMSSWSQTGLPAIGNYTSIGSSTIPWSYSSSLVGNTFSNTTLLDKFWWQ